MHRQGRPGRGGGERGRKGLRSRPSARIEARGPDGTPQVQVGFRGSERWTRGHPWIYRSDVEEGAGALEQLQGGEVVRVLDGRGWLLGQALYSKHSKITLRWLTNDDAKVDADFFRARLQRADELRRRALPGEDTYRVVHGEADLIPGLVVDRYGDYLSVQFLVAGTEQRKQLLTDLLVELFKPRAIVNRSDVGVRVLEGLPQEKGVLYGTLPGPVPYDEGLVRVRADLLEGQKTGSFL